MSLNLHSLYLSKLPLGVECACGRRVLVNQGKVDARDGNMKELRFVKERLKCLKCGKRPTELRVSSTETAARAFERPGARVWLWARHV
jgi:hypothetical protein